MDASIAGLSAAPHLNPLPRGEEDAQRQVRGSSTVQALRRLSIVLAIVVLSGFSACNRVSGSKLTTTNYDQIKEGMSKMQVETIIGQPTTVDSKDMLIFKKTTYRYEDGAKFAMISFKNDEVDGKDTNLNR